MTRVAPSSEPLTGVTRLLVDGTNLLHALARGPTGPDRQPPAALIGRLRAAIPAETSIELIFDGPAEPGLTRQRIAHGVTVRYGGRHTADTVLITLVEEVVIGAGGGPGGGSPAADKLLVVTDDRELRAAVTRRGARTAGSSWLLRRMERPRLSSPSVANPRPPRPAHVDQGPPGTDTSDPDKPGWSPGRHATRKRGPGKRPPKQR
jgi:predicted RNA-binding protein with PIN domain